MAVAWPMPWLAPVTMATEFDIRVSSFEASGVSATRFELLWRRQTGQEVADRRGDLRGVGLQREVAGVEEAHDARPGCRA